MILYLNEPNLNKTSTSKFSTCFKNLLKDWLGHPGKGNFTDKKCKLYRKCVNFTKNVNFTDKRANVQ